MTDPDLTAPEAVERLAHHYDNANGHLPNPSENLTSATLRALSAALQAEKARAEALDAKLNEAVGVMQRIRDYRYDPNIGIELNRLEAFLASLEG